MRVADLTSTAMAKGLASPLGLLMETGPFTVRIRTRIKVIADFLLGLYSDFPFSPPSGMADFRIRLKRPDNLRRIVRSQVIFEHDGHRLFEPFPLTHAPPLFEWGLNWCIGTQAHQYLILHAAALERDGQVVIMPALPGSGKSTLCAALMLNGWRLLSDEFGLVRSDGLLDPLPRPIPLKNQSIRVIQRFSSNAVLGPEFPKTRKGTVAHLKPTTSSVKRMREPAMPKWIVFPRFSPDKPADLKPVIPSYALLKLATNSFNYEVLGAEGFRRVSRLTRQCQHYNFSYGRLEEALDVFDSLK